MSSPIRRRTSRFTHGRLPDRTVSNCGWDCARQSSANSSGRPNRLPRRWMLVRQSTQVPKTSKISARIVTRILPVMEDVLQERLAALSFEQKVRLLTGADFWSLHAEAAVRLRAIVMSDGPAGVRGRLWDERDPSANVPSPTALAATWDPVRVERMGRLLAFECRRKGVDVLLAPTVNLHRTPFGGRHFECFSEDPWLTAVVGCAYVRGLQEEGVAATVKHFVANDSETERFTLDARVSERVLRELYLAPFEAILAETPWAVMAAYNAVNGALMTESPLLRDPLKDEWGFDGVVVSDWGAARSLDAARAALDLVMPGPSGVWADLGDIDVDDKILRLLRLAARVGALDGARPVTVGGVLDGGPAGHSAGPL